MESNSIHKEVNSLRKIIQVNFGSFCVPLSLPLSLFFLFIYLFFTHSHFGGRGFFFPSSFIHFHSFATGLWIFPGSFLPFLLLLSSLFDSSFSFSFPSFFFAQFLLYSPGKKFAFELGSILFQWAICLPPPLPPPPPPITTFDTAGPTVGSHVNHQRTFFWNASYIHELGLIRTVAASARSCRTLPHPTAPCRALPLPGPGPRLPSPGCRVVCPVQSNPDNVHVLPNARLCTRTTMYTLSFTTFLLLLLLFLLLLLLIFPLGFFERVDLKSAQKWSIDSLATPAVSLLVLVRSSGAYRRRFKLLILPISGEGGGNRTVEVICHCISKDVQVADIPFPLSGFPSPSYSGRWSGNWYEAISAFQTIITFT